MQRLKTRPQFQASLAGGTVSRTAHFALHRMVWENDRGDQVAASQANAHSGSGTLLSQQAPQTLFAVQGVWMGAMAPKRWARRAVTRNTIKRQIYTVADAYAQRLAPAAYVVRLRSGFDRKQFVSATSDALKDAVRAELTQLFGYAVRKSAPPAVSVAAGVVAAAVTSAPSLPASSAQEPAP